MEPAAIKDGTDAADGGAVAEAEELLAEAAAEEGAEAQAPNLDKGDEVAVEQPQDGEKESKKAPPRPQPQLPRRPPPRRRAAPHRADGARKGAWDGRG